MDILQSDIAISSQADLVAVLRAVKVSLASGQLRQLTIADSAVAMINLNTVSEDGPWPDYFEAALEDTNGQRYRLAVETYHGAGGSWRRI